MTENTFGLWAGTAINDTSSVVAAGYIFSDAAGAYATIVKLTRTTMIIPIALIYVAFMASKKKQRAKESGTDFSIKTIIPWFVLWFLAAACLNTVGIISGAARSSIDMAGEIPDYHGPRRSRTASLDIRQMLGVGIKPMVLGLMVWISVSVMSLLVQHFILGQL